MNNSTPTFPTDKTLVTDHSSPSIYPSTSFQTTDSILQAQREWRLNKRRELDAKARKKQLRRESLMSSTSVIQPPPLSSNPSFPTNSPYANLSASSASLSFPAGAVFAPHSTEIHQLQPQSAISNAIQHHIPSSSHINISSVKPDVILSHPHLAVGSKRSATALDDPTTTGTDDAADAVVAATAAAVHAAASASPGDPQFANSLPVGASVAHSVALLHTDVTMAAHDAHRIAMENYEAQKRWREEKRRQLAEKKAKGNASKRGRKKARTGHAPSICEATAQLEASVQVAIAQTPMRSQTHSVVPSAGFMTNLQDANVQVEPQQDPPIEDDPTAMYVKNAPGVEHGKEGDDAVGEVSTHPLDIDISGPDETANPMQKPVEAQKVQSEADVTVSVPMPQTSLGMSALGHPASIKVSMSLSRSDFGANQGVTDLEEHMMKGNLVDRGTVCQMVNMDGSRAEESKPQSANEEVNREDALVESAAAEAETVQMDSHEDGNDVQPVEHVEKESDNEHITAVDTTHAAEVAAAVAGVDGGEDEMLDDEKGTKETSKPEESNLAGLDEEAEKDDAKADDVVEVDETKADDFSGVPGDDMMTAAWQSLDSISNT